MMESDYREEAEVVAIEPGHDVNAYRCHSALVVAEYSFRSGLKQLLEPGPVFWWDFYITLVEETAVGANWA
jgi:hypothetical protein